jgi:HAD superfamily hydrolase (TIGR01509 family)
MSDYPSAVLFDMDGTLIDTLPLWRTIDREVIAGYGCELTDDVLDSARHHLSGSIEGIHMFRSHLMRTVGAGITVEQFARDSDDHMARHLRSGVAWMRGARELLYDVCSRGIPAALVTTSPRMLVDAWFSTHEESAFDAVVAGDDVVHGKPHPEPYLTAARLLGVDPASCVAIEDTISGYTSAHDAGCTTVLVSTDPHPVNIQVATLESVTVDHLRVICGRSA